MLHGLFGHQRNLYAVAKALSTRFSVVVVDQRNHGESPHTPSHTIPEMTEDLLELVDHLGIDQFVLFGHSMGGMVAMQAALTNPDRLKALVVEDIGPVITRSITEEIVRVLASIDLVSKTTKSEIESELAYEMRDRTVVKFFMTNITRNQNQDRFEWKFNLPVLTGFVQTFHHFSLPAGKRFHGPTLFIGGNQSQHNVKAQEDQIKSFFPKGQIVMIKGAGHWVHFDKKEELITLIRVFSDRHGL